MSEWVRYADGAAATVIYAPLPHHRREAATLPATFNAFHAIISKNRKET